MKICRYLLITLLGFSCTPVLATTLIPLNLQQLAQRAAIIFEGQCVKNETRIDLQTNRVATFTTFKVNELVKGQAGDTYTIKQIGGNLPGSQFVHKVHGVPRFITGKEYVLFLPAPSGSGFSSPIGLAQGKFNINQINGQRTVSNGRVIESLAVPASNAAIKAASVQTLPALSSIGTRPTMADLGMFKNYIRQLTSE